MMSTVGLLRVLCFGILMYGSWGVSSAVAEEARAVQLPLVTLVDQENRTHRLEQLFEKRTVIIDFIFTSCKTSCSILSAIMAQVEQEVQERLGNELIIVSITVDPAHDTPVQLENFARRFATTAHWYWLTGAVSDVTRVLRAFNIPIFGKPEDHPPVIMAGNLRTGKWQRWVGIPDPHAVAQTALALTKQ